MCHVVELIVNHHTQCNMMWSDATLYDHSSMSYCEPGFFSSICLAQNNFDIVLQKFSKKTGWINVRVNN